jgi:L-fuconolactonase
MAITRREFLVQTAAAAALDPAMLSADPTPAIDTHTHFYDPSRPKGVPWPNKNEQALYRTVLPPEFGDLTAKYGVLGTVVVEASPWVEDNQWILELAKTNPMIVGFIGNLDPLAPEFRARLDRFGADPLFLGLRFGQQTTGRGLGTRPFENALGRMNEETMTIDLVGGPGLLGDGVRIAKLAPKARVVIDHLPFGDWDNNPTAMRRALEEIAALPNVYAKVSNVARRVDGRVVDDLKIYRPGLDIIWGSFGPDRVIYGSNWPVSDKVAPYLVVHKIVSDYVASHGKEIAEKYFWRNSFAAYRWQPRGAAERLVK